MHLKSVTILLDDDRAVMGGFKGGALGAEALPLQNFTI